MTVLCRVGLILIVLIKIPALRAQKTLKITKVPDSPVYVEIGKVLKLDISYEYDGNRGIITDWKKGGSDTAFIRRTVNGDIIGNVDNRALITDETDLVLNNITLSDNTTFEVLLTATDSLIQPDETIQVIVVQELPMAQIGCIKPTNITEGGTLICDCKAIQGIPTPWVTWYDKDNKHIGSAGYGSKKLSIIDIQPDKAGVYKCEAKIASGFDNEDSVTINVEYPLENVKFGGKIAYLNTKFTLTCSAEGFPTPTYTISHKETELVKDSTSGTYTINSVKKSDAGEYTCVAKNALGNIKTSITVEVSGDPPPTTSTTAHMTISSNTKSSNTEESSSATCDCKWYLNVICVICGLVVGGLLTYIIMRWRQNKAKGEDKVMNDTGQYAVPSDTLNRPTEYHELDVSKMNRPANYQSLKKPNEQTSGDLEYEDVIPSDYQQLSNVREPDQQYQPLKKV